MCSCSLRVAHSTPSTWQSYGAGWQRRACADGVLLTLGSGKVSSPSPALSAPVKGDPTHHPELLRGPWPESQARSRVHGLAFSPLIPLQPHLTSWAELTPPTTARPCPGPGVSARLHIPDSEAQSTGCTSTLWHLPAPQSLTDDL